MVLLKTNNALTTWNDIEFIIKNTNKKICLYGRSEDWIPKLLRKLNIDTDRLVICDNDRSLVNSYFMNIKVKYRSFFSNKLKNYFFIICTSRYISAEDDLKKN
jgi:hypothetical protein